MPERYGTGSARRRDRRQTYLSTVELVARQLMNRFVPGDTGSFHAQGYPLHEKSTAFPDGKNITPLPQNSLSAVCMSMFQWHFSLAGSLCANPSCPHCRHAEGVYFSEYAVLASELADTAYLLKTDASHLPAG